MLLSRDGRNSGLREGVLQEALARNRRPKDERVHTVMWSWYAEDDQESDRGMPRGGRHEVSVDICTPA